MSQLQLEGVFHDNTPTSKKLRSIERTITRELDTLVAKIKQHINPLSPAHDIDSKFKPLYEQQVYDILRAGAQEAYQLGSDYVSELKIFKNLHTFLTQEDIIFIENLTQEYVSRFWGKLALTTSRGGNKIFGTAITIDKELGFIEPKNTFLNPRYIVDPISIGLTNVALNQATINKIRYHAENVNPVTINTSLQTERLAQAATQEEQLLEQAEQSAVSIDSLASLGILSNIISSIASVKLIWITAKDERVCFICRPLHGKKWNVFDPNVPIPVVGTHERCRCRVTVLDETNKFF